MKEDISYFEENYLIVIEKDGKMTSVPRIKDEDDHYSLFDRLNQKLKRNVDINSKNPAPARILANIYAKNGYIVIFPFLVSEEISKNIFIVVFPFEPTKEQLISLTTLYGALETLEIGYLEEPSTDEEGLNLLSDLVYPKKPGYQGEQNITGFELLKRFVQKKLEEYNKNQGNEKEGLGRE